MKVKYFLVVACIFSSFFLLQARFDEYIALSAAWSSVITDKFQCRILGDEDVSEELYMVALNVFQSLNIENPEKIHVKRASPLLRSCVGSQTCIATYNALFVDEEWLLSLQPDEQKFVLAHEAMHIQNKDMAKKIGIYLALVVALSASIAYFKQKKYGWLSVGVLGVVELAVFAAYHRYQEARADAGAERVAPHAFQGTDVEQQNQSGIQKIWLWCRSWFSEYHHDRFKKNSQVSSSSL